MENKNTAKVIKMVEQEGQRKEVADLLQVIDRCGFYTDYEYEVLSDLVTLMAGNNILAGGEMRSHVLWALHIGYMHGLDTGIKEALMRDELEPATE